MRKLNVACLAVLAGISAGAQSKATDAVSSGIEMVRSGVSGAVSGVADVVDPSAPNMLSLEMKEENFFDQPLSFQTNLLRLAACANAAYPGVDIPDGYRPFTDAEWRACGLDAVAMAPYAGDGYLHYATGLRVRLMASEGSDGIVVAWSGCDFDNGSSGFSDTTSVTRQYFGYLDGQYAQALRIMNGVLSSTSGRVEVVGHSLGGGLTTYVVAACSDGKGRVTGTTFNGLGLSRLLQARLSADQRRRAEASVVNVKSSADPVFVMPMARHYGRIYDIPQKSDAWKAHSIDILIGVMRRVVAEFKTMAKGLDRTVYQFSVKDRTGVDVPLGQYRGKVLLVVNTATRCGFTPQYEGLEAMYERLKGRGFELLDFPCNQFGQQAPGTDEEIHGFCVLNYKTEFPQFAKVEVNGENAAPLFKFLVANTKFEGFPPDGKIAPILEQMLGKADPDYAKKPDIKWNFTKFLIGKDGRVVRRFEPTAPLADVESAIRAELAR